VSGSTALAVGPVDWGGPAGLAGGSAVAVTASARGFGGGGFGGGGLERGDTSAASAAADTEREGT